MVFTQRTWAAISISTLFHRTNQIKMTTTSQKN